MAEIEPSALDLRIRKLQIVQSAVMLLLVLMSGMLLVMGFMLGRSAQRGNRILHTLVARTSPAPCSARPLPAGSLPSGTASRRPPATSVSGSSPSPTTTTSTAGPTTTPN